MWHRPFGLRRVTLITSALLASSVASPAFAQFEPKTELVRCGEDSCLQISGYRNDPALIVTLNGKEMPAEGKQGWRIRLPLETVRQISSPYARAIEVSLRDPESSAETTATAPLPIGLLGGITDLATIKVTAS